MWYAAFAATGRMLPVRLHRSNKFSEYAVNWYLCSQYTHVLFPNCNCCRDLYSNIRIWKYAENKIMREKRVLLCWKRKLKCSDRWMKCRWRRTVQHFAAIKKSDFEYILDMVTPLILKQKMKTCISHSVTNINWQVFTFLNVQHCFPFQSGRLTTVGNSNFLLHDMNLWYATQSNNTMRPVACYKSRLEQ
jgi:hypothetical protein